MKTIYKYEVKIEDEFSIDMPIGARILSVQVQNGLSFVWALVDTKMPPVAYPFFLRGTGHPSEGLDVVEYVGTFQLRNGALVFHLFRGR